MLYIFVTSLRSSWSITSIFQLIISMALHFAFSIVLQLHFLTPPTHPTVLIRQTYCLKGKQTLGPPFMKGNIAWLLCMKGYCLRLGDVSIRKWARRTFIRQDKQISLFQTIQRNDSEEFSLHIPCTYVCSMYSCTVSVYSFHLHTYICTFYNWVAHSKCLIQNLLIKFT